jgi:hypothetical protein
MRIGAHDVKVYRGLWRGLTVQISIVPVIAVFLMLDASLCGQDKKPYVLLPQNATRAVSHFCSREGLPNVQGTWHPTTGTVELLETRLNGIPRLQTEVDSKSTGIGDPDGYYRQYIAIVLNGHRLIYVNAFSYPAPSSWQARLVDLCNTGPGGWGILYDPVTGHFSDLRINAMLPPPPPPPGVLKSANRVN